LGVLLRAIGPTPTTQEPLSGVGCGNRAARRYFKVTVLSGGTAVVPDISLLNSGRLDQAGAAEPAPVDCADISLLNSGRLDQAGAAEPEIGRGSQPMRSLADLSLF
jgi:hypothetical protein